MSRTMLLVFLLLILIITSQFEWKQQLVAEVDTSSDISDKQQLPSSKREEAIKEKIILSQEKNIQRLNELVRSLHEQLSLCRANEGTANKTAALLTDHVFEAEGHVLED